MVPRCTRTSPRAQVDERAVDLHVDLPRQHDGVVDRVGAVITRRHAGMINADPEYGAVRIAWSQPAASRRLPSRNCRRETTRSTRPRSFRDWAGGTSRSCRFRRWRRQRDHCRHVQSRRVGFSTPFLVSRLGSCPADALKGACMPTPRDHRVTLVMYTIKLPWTSGQGRHRRTAQTRARCKAARLPRRDGYPGDRDGP